MLASKFLGNYYRNHPTLLEIKIREWSSSDNMWLNRTAILVQLKYKESTRLDLLEHAILPHIDSTEFFIQKAIGWALRELAKTNKIWVMQFVESHTLKPLSRREALKHM